MKRRPLLLDVTPTEREALVAALRLARAVSAPDRREPSCSLSRVERAAVNRMLERLLLPTAQPGRSTVRLRRYTGAGVFSLDLPTCWGVTQDGWATKRGYIDLFMVEASEHEPGEEYPVAPEFMRLLERS